MSAHSRSQIEEWAKRIKAEKLASGLPTAMDYSEFWVELRPKDHGDNQLPHAMGPERRLSPLLVPMNPSMQSAEPNRSPPLDVTKLLNGKAAGTHPTLANWSEEAFGEITPEFAEVVGPDDLQRVERAARPANAVLTIRAIDRGQPVSKEYYKNILQSIHGH